MSRQRAISNTWHRSIDNIVIWFYVNGKLILLLNAFALTNFTCYNTRLIDRAKSGCTPYHLCIPSIGSMFWFSFLYCPFLNLIVDSIKRQVEMKWIKKLTCCKSAKKKILLDIHYNSLSKENRPNAVRCAVLYRTSLNLIRLVALICVRISDFVGQLKHEILIKIKKAIIDFNEATSTITSTGTITITITKLRTKGLEKKKAMMNTSQTTPAEDIHEFHMTNPNKSPSFLSFVYKCSEKNQRANQQRLI